MVTELHDSIKHEAILFHVICAYIFVQEIKPLNKLWPKTIRFKDIVEIIPFNDVEGLFKI